MAGRSVQSNVVIRINDREITNTFRGLQREVNRLERELRGTTVGSEEFIRTSAQLRQVRARFNEVRDEIRGTNEELQESTSMMGRFKEIFTGNVAADLFSNATSKLMEWGKQLAERVIQLNKIKNNLVALDRDLKGISLDRAAVSVQSISDTYEKSIEDIEAAVKALNSMTGDTNKSLDLIKKGFDSGADASGEFLTQLKEYPTMMNDAKVSAEEMIAIISQSEQMGIYDDKGIDAIKEGMLRVREGTKSTKDAMRALGIDVDATYKKIASGALNYFDVLKLVSGKIKETGADSRLTGTAIADIFGGPGEDAGFRYLSQLKDINTNLDDLNLTANETVIAKKYELEANERLNSVWVQLTGTASSLSKAYSSVKNGLASVLEFTFNVKQAKLSDEYLEQEYRLRYLKTQLDNTNISQARKLAIYKELKTEWPQYFSGLDLEKMKHDDITKAINRSIDAMGRKYKAQVFQEKYDVTSLDAKDRFIDVINYEEQGKQLIGQFQKQFPDFKLKSQHTVNQLREIGYELDKVFKEQRGDGTIFDSKSWQSLDTHLLRSVRSITDNLSKANVAFNIAEKKRIEDQNRLNEVKSNLLPDVFDTSVKTTPSKDVDLDAQAAAEKAAAAAAKKALKDGESAAKKLAQQKLADNKDAENMEIESNNKLLELESEFLSKKAEIEDAGFKKDIDAENAKRSLQLAKQTEFQDETLRKIKDLEEKIIKTKSPEALEDYKTSLQNQRKILYLHDQIIIQEEETHQKKLETIRNNWSIKEFDKLVKTEQQKLEKSTLAKEQEIQNITSLEEAKQKLQNSSLLKLTSQELKEIDTLEKAKAALREEANRAMLLETEKAVTEQLSILDNAVKTMSSGPEKEKLEEYIETLKKRISELRASIQGGNESDKAKKKESVDENKEKIDILGFSYKQWEDTFSNLDTLSEKVEAAAMIFQALGNAATMYGDLQRALGEKELRNFTRIQDAKKAELDRKLKLGLISQENYTKETELLDAQLANKQAEIEYKQAKADKISKLFSAIGGVAMGVANSLAVGGPAGIALAAIVGALGAVQIATIAAQPLPELQSYAKGGYFEGFTGDSNLPADETGERPYANVKLHRKEWVAPRWMTEHPVISKDINRLEFMRANKITSLAEGGFADSGNTTTSVAPNSTFNDSTTIQYIAVMNDVKALLRLIYDEGVQSFIVDDAKNWKLINRMNKKWETLENKNKH
ncbi:phage tail tape measure protein [Chryseobacterium sp. 2R14A]|uniref:phage tail tape measure protein n=1 Tax=Chryseobacterium sp. 2R14A TaxID=3380353 RepID=UPI003CF03A14